MSVKRSFFMVIQFRRQDGTGGERIAHFKDIEWQN